MTDMTVIGTDRIVISDDCSADIVRFVDGTWKVFFLDGEGRTMNAPHHSEVVVESIGSDFIVRVLAVSRDDESDAIVATGITELANYARISVVRDHKWNTRYQLLNNTKTPEIPVNSRGLPIVDMGHDSFIEVSIENDELWELIFYKNDDEVDAPNPKIIQVEALKGDGTVCNLQVTRGSKPSMLVASGSIEDTTRIRLLWAHGDHFHRREFNVPP